jgi:hypothetical protein
MIRKHYWASALMVITAVGLAGTAMVPSTISVTSIESLGQQYDAASERQNRDPLATADAETTKASLEILHADSHRGSGRLTAKAINPAAVLAWRGTGRIAPMGPAALA